MLTNARHLLSRRALRGLSALFGLFFLLSACTPAEVFTLSGQVSGAWQCVNGASSRMPTMIRLQPLNWTAPFSAEEPKFTFSGVRPGDYSLEAICTGLGVTFPEMPVTVSTSDVDAEVVLPFPNLPRHSPAATLSGHQGYVLGLAFSDDSSILISVGEDGILARWDVSTGQRLEGLSYGLADATLPVALSLDGTLIASGTAGGDITLWDGRTGELRHTLTGLDGRLEGIVVSPNGVLAAGWQDGENPRAAVWNILDDDLLYAFDMSQDQSPVWWAKNAFLFTPDSASLVSVAMQNQGWLVEWRSSIMGSLLSSTSPPGVERVRLSTVYSAALSPDGKRFAFGTAGVENTGSLALWDLTTNDITTGRFPSTIDRVAFSPDGAMVATTAHDNTVVLWNAAPITAQHVLVGDGRGIDAFAWSPDGVLLAAADGTGKILLWKVP